MQYQQIIGHETIKEQLKNIVHSGKISHAYIFDGPDGIGKSMMAHAFASSIVCDNFQQEPCGVCKNCHLSFGNSHPDIIEMDLTIDKNGDIKESISVDAVRELKKDVYIKPFFADRKVYIIPSAQKMTVEAQNALLKVFEEPPRFATFILLTNGLSKLLPTILSRGVIVKFQLLSKEELLQFAVQNGLKDDNRKVLTNLSNGQIGRLIALSGDEELIELRNETLKGFEALVVGQKQNAIDRMFLLMKERQEKASDIIEFLTIILSDIGLIRSGNSGKIINSDQLQALNELAEILNYHTLNNLLMCTLSFSEGQQKNQNYLVGMMKLLISMWEEIHG
jgi:DNA polymerase III, delta prime subunit